MAIDYGRKRAGVAVTDNLQLIANGLETVPSHSLFEFLSSYFKKEEVETVVVGYPVQMNNTASDAVRYVNEFIRKFVKTFPTIPLVQMDERFTSKMAFQAMIDGGMKKKQRQDKAVVDKVSATIILQSWLESRENSSNFTK